MLKCFHPQIDRQFNQGMKLILILKIFPELGNTYCLGCEELESTWIWEPERL